MNKELHPSALIEGTIVYIENNVPMRFVKQDGSFLVFQGPKNRKLMEIKTYTRLLNKNLVSTQPIGSPQTNKDFWDNLISGV